MTENTEFEDIEYLEEYIYEIEEENIRQDHVNQESPQHEVEFYTSSSGYLRLSFDGFTYRIDKNDGKKSYFKCQNLDLGCKSRIVVHTNENGVQTVYPPKIEHNHVIKPLKTATDIALSNLRERAITDRSIPSQIILDFDAQPENQYVNALMPSKNALTQRIYRARAKNETSTPHEPSSLDFEYDRIFCSIDNEYMILNDWMAQDGTERVTIFSTTRFFNFLCQSDIWLCDGTFKTCPKFFYQMVIIHGNLPDDHYVSYPLLFILMTGKSSSLYDKALDMIKQAAMIRGKRIKFTRALFDFEKGILNSFKRAFPHVNYSACLFHFDQNIIKRVKLLGYYSDFLRDHSFYFEMSLLMSLPFLPPEEIPVYFESLNETLSDKAKDVAKWFKHNYILASSGGPPRNEPKFWSIYDNFCNGFPTTQNWAETYHHRLHVVMDKERPPIYKFLSFLKKEFVSIGIDIDKFLSGKPQKHRMPGYEKTENAINLILDRRDSLPYNETLKALFNAKNKMRP